MASFETPETSASPGGVPVTPTPPILAYSAPGQIPVDWLPTLSEHRIDLSKPCKLKTLLKWRITFRLLYSAAVAIGMGIFFHYEIPGNTHGYVFLPMFIMAFGILGAFRTWKRETALMRGLVVYASDLGVMRKADSIPELALWRGEVTKIVDNKYGLMVRTKKGPIFIFLPRDLSNFEPLKQRLQTWMPVVPQRYNALKIAARWGLALGMLAAMGMVIFSRTAWVAIPAGVVVEGLLLWSAIYYLRSPHLTLKRKITLILLLAWIGLWIGFSVIVRIPAISPFGLLAPRTPPPIGPSPAPSL